MSALKTDSASTGAALTLETFTLCRTNLGEGKSIHVFDNRITFLLTPFGGQDPQLVINPNITVHEEEVLSEIINSQNVIETDVVEKTSFSPSGLLRAGRGYLALKNFHPQRINIGGNLLQVTLLQKKLIGEYSYTGVDRRDMEIELMVEEVIQITPECRFYIVKPDNARLPIFRDDNDSTFLITLQGESIGTGKTAVLLDTKDQAHKVHYNADDKLEIDGIIHAPDCEIKGKLLGLGTRRLIRWEQRL